MSRRKLAFFAAFLLTAVAAPLVTHRLTAAAAGKPSSPPPTPQVVTQVAQQVLTQPYFPERLDWQHKRPEEVGMDSAKLAEATATAKMLENSAPQNMKKYQYDSYPREPFADPLGPIKDAGPSAGLITRHGYIVAEWGDPNRVDMTFSVTKTFLTTLIGLAWQRGMIHDVKDYARDYMPPISIAGSNDPGATLFEAPHNQRIKWDDLLRQSSDWSGTLWGKPDWADRPEGEKPSDYPNRKLYEPGTHYKYNDVRVNVMALAALEVWRHPLPEVLREEIMNPIGASSTWRWYGYENSWVDIDGQKMQSMTGGGHWGGGMFINAYDMARFGLLFLRNGKWKNREIVSTKWMDMARTPGPANPTYGFANWYLNPGRKELPSAPATAVRFIGNGNNVVYIDWENDVVAVVRWIRGGDAMDQVVGKMLASIKK